MHRGRVWQLKLRLERTIEKIVGGGGMAVDGCWGVLEQQHSSDETGNWKDNTVSGKKMSPEDSGSSRRHNLGLPFSLGFGYQV